MIHNHEVPSSSLGPATEGNGGLNDLRFFVIRKNPGELPGKGIFTETAAIMEKKTILAACAAATLAFAGCSGGFSAAEEETIHAGKGEIMRILTVGNPATRSSCVKRPLR